MEVAHIDEWHQIEQDIKGFLEVNPTGNLQDLFGFYDPSFRTKYYKHKPADYKFPNAGKKIPKDKYIKEPEESKSDTLAIAKINAITKLVESNTKLAEMIQSS
jgi:hypothetical protein